MPLTVEGAGVELSYRETGSGPALLLVHDMGRDAGAWQALARAAPGRRRIISYDRRGYGASGAPEPYERTTVYEQAEDAAALLERLAASPAVVLGEGFGALVALDLCVRHAARLRAALLIDPPLLAFVPQATEILGEQRERLRATARERGPQAAVAEWLPQRASAAEIVRARSAHRAFFADFAGLSTWPVTRTQLRAICLPLHVITAPDTAPHVLAAADALAGLVAGAQRRRDGDVTGALVTAQA